MDYTVPESVLDADSTSRYKQARPVADDSMTVFLILKRKYTTDLS